MPKSTLLLLMNLGIIAYLIFFSLWAFGMASFPRENLIPMHFAGMFGGLYLLVTLFRHATSNKRLSAHAQALWILSFLTLAPLSTLMYLLVYRHQFEQA